MAMRELLPLRVLLKEMSDKMNLPLIAQSLVRSTVFEDNMGVMSLVNVPKMSTRNKYLSHKYHFFRSEIGEAKGIVAKYIRTEEQRLTSSRKDFLPSSSKSFANWLWVGNSHCFCCYLFSLLLFRSGLASFHEHTTITHGMPINRAYRARLWCAHLCPFQ